MPIRPLPDDPDLGRLKKIAKTLRDAVRGGVPAANALVEEFHSSASRTGFSLSDAQLVVARQYGFASWPRLRQHLAVVAQYARAPHRAGAEFLSLACLTYGGDSPARWDEARRLLDADPALASASLHAAAAVGDASAVCAHLAASDPNGEGGPHRWPPLLYLAYSRVIIPGGDPVEAARLLLAAGADPNAGYLWEGLPSPFTALTGAFGGGEDGRNQPPHPACFELARLLLDAGADPNDSQALYNRHFEPGNCHLELLFSYGLGSGDGGPWHARLGPAHPTPAQMVEDQLLWAATHGRTDRVRLLLGHGVDPAGGGTRHPGHGGRTPAELAALHGHPEIVAVLGEPAGLDAVDRATAALMAGTAVSPQLVRQVRDRYPDLVRRAAEERHPHTVRLLVSAGFDVNARARTTALHEAAWHGDLPMVKLLLSLGADPAITDTAFNATPQGWAEHNHQDEVTAWLTAQGA